MVKGYRYGFNGKENDNEVKGEGNQQDYGMRIYDPRVARFLSVDPLTKQYPHYTPYSFAGNKPIVFIDRDGEEEGIDNIMRRREEAYLSNQMSEDKYREHVRAMGIGGTIGTAVVVDAFVLKGRASQFLFSVQLAGSFDHQRAKTSEGRAEQDYKSKQAFVELALFWSVNRLLGLGRGLLSEGTAGSEELSSINIALGKNKSWGAEEYTNLAEFAQGKGAISFHEFDKIPNYSVLKNDFQNFEGSFLYATDAVKVTNGKVYFNLDGVDLQTVSRIKPGVGLYQQLDELGGNSWWEKSKITEWELRQVTSDRELLKQTEFYKGGKQVSTQSVLKEIE